MQLNSNKVNENNKLGELFFLGAYILFFIASFFKTSMFYLSPAFDSLFSASLGVALIILILKNCMDSFSIKELIIYCLLLIIFIISWERSDSTTILLMFIFVISSKGVHPQIIAWAYLIMSSVSLLIIMGAAHYGVIENLIYLRNGIARHSFGIIYPTDFSSHIFYICCTYVFLREDKYNIWDSILILVVSLMTFRATDARLNFICTVLLVVIRYVVKFDKHMIMRKVAWLAPIISSTSIMWLTLRYDGSNIMNMFNRLLSGRITIVNDTFKEYGISLLGQKVYQNGWGGASFYTSVKYTFIDSAYMRLILMYGLIATLVIILCLVFLTNSVTSELLLGILVVIFISGIAEQHMLEIAYNPFLIMLYSNFYMEYKNKESDNNFLAVV